MKRDTLFGLLIFLLICCPKAGEVRAQNTFKQQDQGTPSLSPSVTSPSPAAYPTFATFATYATSVPGNSSVLPLTLFACIHNPPTFNYTLVRNHSSALPLGPRDAWAPSFGRLVLANDCINILNHNCEIVYKPGGCYDDDIATSDRCVALRPNVTIVLQETSSSQSRYFQQQLPSTDESIIFPFSVTKITNTSSSYTTTAFTSSTTIVTTITTNITTTYSNVINLVETTITNTTNTTVRQHAASCSPFPSCFIAGATCEFVPMPLPPSPPPIAYGLPPSQTSPSSYYPPGKPPRNFNIFTFGAVGDGITDDTAAVATSFQKACSYAQSTKQAATVLLPGGRSFFMRYLQFQGPCGATIYFQIDGKILGPRNPSAHNDDSIKALLEFQDFDGIALVGKGGVDGRGQQFWTAFEDGTLERKRPVLVEIKDSVDVLVSGITLWNAPAIHLNINSCKRVTVRGFYTNSPQESPNTDSLHITETQDVLVEESTLFGGDDCISIEAGTHNLLVRNFWCTGGHGISIGSLGDDDEPACVSNITVDRVVIMDNSNGVRIKTYQGGVGSVSNVTFKNIFMNNVSRPIVINQNYCDKKSVDESKCKPSTAGVAISDVSFFHIMAYTNKTDGNGYYFNCSKTVPCMNINLNDIKIEASDEYITLGPPIFENVYGSLNDVYHAGSPITVQIPSPSVSPQTAALINQMGSPCGVKLPPNVPIRGGFLPFQG